MKKAVIIVAGGNGSRMGAAVPKQFLIVKGKPILMHTMEAFYNYDNSIEIILVLPETQLEYWEELKKKNNFIINHKITSGGKERFFSVKNGLSYLNPEIEVVGIHDGVRPLASQETIQKCFEKADENGASIPVVKLRESIRKIGEGRSKSLNREDYCLVQTPQCFRKEILLQAYNQEYQEIFTDDASVVEAAGYDINLAEGNYENIKITTPSDIVIAEALLGQK